MDLIEYDILIANKEISLFDAYIKARNKLHQAHKDNDEIAIDFYKSQIGNISAAFVAKVMVENNYYFDNKIDNYVHRK